MVKDFGKFINEGYTYSFEDSFVTEIDTYLNIDANNIEEKYESVDNINTKVNWKIQMEVQKDGIYDFNFTPIKATVYVEFLLKPEDGVSEEEYEDKYEERNYEIEADNIKIENADSYKQLIIEDIEIDFNKGEKVEMICKMMEA